jgi:hypothetical protein
MKNMKEPTMKPYRTWALGIILVLTFSSLWLPERVIQIPKEILRDKIKGGWAGQVIGCTFGGPMEFRFRSTFIPDYLPLEWNKERIIWYYDNAPGLYDDIYMDLTFVEVLEKEGMEAPAERFALAFANADYPLWHANQAARYNILQGIMPPESGHWLNNPHADDIDFQIEADFAGLMAPGLTNVAVSICDKIGHIMNFGDGWYGGVYIAAMYTLAFTSTDVERIVEDALKVIPQKSTYHQCMKDVIRWHREYPGSWKAAWFKVQEKWGQDVGCPEGVFMPFNIDAKINSAWVLIGLLYGKGDFGKTISIAARCGDDSDCNSASAGGILGTMLGYSRIPSYWKQGLDEVEERKFRYTNMSLKDAYDLSLKHALKIIESSGGKVTDHKVSIPTHTPATVRMEVCFEGHRPIKRIRLGKSLMDEIHLGFEGVGFALTGEAIRKGEKDYVFTVEMTIDGRPAGQSKLPTNSLRRKNTPFWKYRLPPQEHTVSLKVLNPTKEAVIELHDLIIYGDKSDPPIHCPWTKHIPQDSGY